MVPETLYLTVNLIDRYLEVKPVRRSKLQLVGVAALLVRFWKLLTHFEADSDGSSLGYPAFSQI